MRRATLTTAVMLVTTAVVIGTAVAQGMATVTIGVNIDGSPANGKISVKDSNGGVVADGAPDEAINVPEGTYDVFIECTALVDKPKHVTRGFSFVGGRTYACKKSFSASTITLLTKKGGRRLNGEVILQREGGGEPVAKVRGWQQFKITAGRYQGTYKSGRDEWPIKGLLFPEGATESIPVNF